MDAGVSWLLTRSLSSVCKCRRQMPQRPQDFSKVHIWLPGYSVPPPRSADWKKTVCTTHGDGCLPQSLAFLKCVQQHTYEVFIPSAHSQHLNVVETILLCSGYLGNKPVIKQLAHFLIFFFAVSLQAPTITQFTQRSHHCKYSLAHWWALHTCRAGKHAKKLTVTDRSLTFPSSFSTIISRMLGSLHWFPLFTSSRLYTKEQGTVLVFFPSWYSPPPALLQPSQVNGDLTNSQ